jgi:hypothetical protein
MRRLPPIAAGLLALVCTACGPKLARQTVFTNERVSVELRETLRDGEVARRGYSHPAHIADVRLAHILASLSHQRSGGELESTVRSLHVYDLAEGMARAFDQATPDQEVVAAAFARDRNLGIFTVERVTALRAHLEGDQLVLEFFAVEEELGEERHERGAERFEIPAELPAEQPRFRLIPGQAQTPRGARGLAIAWRDDYYRQPVNLRFDDGRVRRRTTLLEAPPEAVEGLPPPPSVERSQLSDAQLRALDRLEGARRSGYVSEAEFRRRQRLILEGELEEAGYGSDPR